MFAENGKISYRQLRRLYVFNLLGVGTLVIPTEIALLGKYGFGCIKNKKMVFKKQNSRTCDICI